ncbi:hypothetical protein Acr_00g0057380 [Actinidia rufa]|uniref:Uncharacterized protein n=1 Tax=Actinidia rufa TaxID=165716 RepID=A0A7J0DN33_9ERIC|nr:hypothetical protein Acr_00g0057380 [Actinidia rufa]
MLGRARAHGYGGPHPPIRGDTLTLARDQPIQLQEPLENYGHLGPHEAAVNRVKKTKKKVGSLESELNKAKLALATTDQLKADLVATENAQDVSYAAATQTQNEVFNKGISRAGDNYDRQEGGKEASADEASEPVREAAAKEVEEAATQDLPLES